jgi:hypothetical protein
MREGFDTALESLDLPTGCLADARKHLVGVIIEGVDAGERDPTVLADGAKIALRRAFEGGLASE